MKHLGSIVGCATGRKCLVVLTVALLLPASIRATCGDYVTLSDKAGHVLMPIVGGAGHTEPIHVPAAPCTGPLCSENQSAVPVPVAPSNSEQQLPICSIEVHGFTFCFGGQRIGNAVAFSPLSPLCPDIFHPPRLS